MNPVKFRLRTDQIPYRPVVKLKQGVVIIEWTTAKQHERQQRIADSS
jgi:hypothetical protein